MIFNNIEYIKTIDNPCKEENEISSKVLIAYYMKIDKKSMLRK